MIQSFIKHVYIDSLQNFQPIRVKISHGRKHLLQISITERIQHASIFIFSIIIPIYIFMFRRISLNLQHCYYII